MIEYGNKLDQLHQQLKVKEEYFLQLLLVEIILQKLMEGKLREVNLPRLIDINICICFINTWIIYDITFHYFLHNLNYFTIIITLFIYFV